MKFAVVVVFIVNELSGERGNRGLVVIVLDPGIEIETVVDLGFRVAVLLVVGNEIALLVEKLVGRLCRKNRGDRLVDFVLEITEGGGGGGGGGGGEL